MTSKKSRGLVSYDMLPTVIKRFFKILPETEVEEPRKRIRNDKKI